MLLLLVSCLVGSCLLCSWEVFTVCFFILSIISISFFKQNFSMLMDLVFWNSSMSSLLLFLSSLMCFLCFSVVPYEKGWKYGMNLLFLGASLIFVFTSPNLICFYFFFEISLIPTLILIIGWGYQPERLQAGSYMMIYTVGSSLPLFLLLMWSSIKSGTMQMVISNSLCLHFNSIWFLVVYGAFLVKLPMYSLHMWLPKAHVEAPLAGSMILAGVLLKLGGYGLYLMNWVFSLPFSFISSLIVSVSLWGGLLSSLLCLRQTDVKSLVAYSSIGHMGIVSSGMLLDSSWGFNSAVITMLAHGFSSSALFCIAYFTYTKTSTRNIPFMKGMLSMYPVLSLMWFVFCSINMAAPPTINLVGELVVMSVLFKNSGLVATIMCLMVFMSAAYNMYLYTVVNHGNTSKYISGGGSSLKSYEMLSLMLHLCPLLLLTKGNILV